MRELMLPGKFEALPSQPNGIRVASSLPDGEETLAWLISNGFRRISLAHSMAAACPLTDAELAEDRVPGKGEDRKGYYCRVLSPWKLRDVPAALLRRLPVAR